MSLTILMYHYVRDLEGSRYPGIKGRRVREFRAQLDHIASRYSVVTAEQVIAAVERQTDLPANAAWLTFDDGYLDHYTNVFPLLHERGWQGSFFPPARTIVARELLDVNKIHFILAAEPDPAPLIAAIGSFVAARQARSDVMPFHRYWESIDKADRYDLPGIVFIKRMLQHRLPEDLRTELADELFARHVSVDATAFANELYMSADQLKLMLKCGMHVGSHGDRHYWLDRISVQDQDRDIGRAIAFLADLGAPIERWIMCYPYGAYNADTLRILSARGCAIGLTTRVGVADLKGDPALELPRLDTNDLPFA
jgi:peptidoglycan/xylan/chitin deacetylase (PgdA/CDA1 family)